MPADGSPHGVVALVTDSNTQLPARLRDRFDIRVVPMTVVVDGVAHREGHDLDAAEFVARLRAGATVSTAAPAPGEIRAAYDEAVAGGAERIVSVHVGANVSGTLNAAAVAADGCAVPVTLVDTRTASFAAGCCVWAAGEALASGGGADAAAAAARRAAERVGNVFIVSSLDPARRSGRLAGAETDPVRVPVLALDGDQMRVVGETADAGGAVEAMVGHVAGWARAGERLRVGVGDTDAPAVAAALEAALAALPSVDEVVRYHVGPSVAAHTGPGTVGAVFTPR